LHTIFEYTQLHLFGKIDPDLKIEFKPLWTPSELEQSQIQLNKQQKTSGYIADGVIHPIEARDSLMEDPHSGYNNLMSNDEFLAQVNEGMDDEENTAT
jgi:hypothetical protein